MATTTKPSLSRGRRGDKGDSNKKRSNLASTIVRTVRKMEPFYKSIPPEDVIVVTVAMDPKSPFCDQSEFPRIADPDFVDDIYLRGVMQAPVVQEVLDADGQLKTYAIVGRRRIDGRIKANDRFTAEGKARRLLEVYVRNDLSHAEIREWIAAENVKRQDMPLPARVQQARLLVEEYKADAKAEGRTISSHALHERASKHVGATTKEVERWMHLHTLPAATREAIYLHARDPSKGVPLALVDDLRQMTEGDQAKAIEAATGAATGSAAKRAAAATPRNSTPRRSGVQWQRLRERLLQSMRHDEDLLKSAGEIPADAIRHLAVDGESDHPLLRAIMRCGASVLAAFQVCDLDQDAIEPILCEPQADDEDSSLERCVVEGATLRVGDLRLETNQAFFNDKDLGVSVSECIVLRLLASSTPKVVSKSVLAEAADVTEKSLMNLVMNLRRKTEECFEIITVLRRGFQLCVYAADSEDAADEDLGRVDGAGRPANDVDERQAALPLDIEEEAEERAPEEEEELDPAKIVADMDDDDEYVDDEREIVLDDNGDDC